MRTPIGDRFEDFAAQSYDVYMYLIEHEDIVAHNRTPFLEFWNIKRISNAGLLPRFYGKVRVAVDGYDHDQRELFEIPEVRKYLGLLTDEWPYFFYACDLRDRFLNTLVRCLVPDLKV